MIRHAEEPRFTAADQRTWRRFFSEIEQLWDLLGPLLHPYYRDHVGQLREFREQIPTMAQINQLLSSIGWTARYVDGYAPSWEIARLLANQVMPLARTIRPYDEVFFGNEPDIIHDIFGHLPSLLSPDYRRLLAQWSQAACRQPVTEVDLAHYHLNKLIVQSQDKIPQSDLAHLTAAAKSVDRFIAAAPSGVLAFDKAYFWIFEFGMIEHQGQRQVLGAGLLSSLTELSKLATGKVTTRPLALDTILASYNISAFQDEYLVGGSIGHYAELLRAVNSPTATPPLARELRYAHR